MRDVISVGLQIENLTCTAFDFAGVDRSHAGLDGHRCDVRFLADHHHLVGSSLLEGDGDIQLVLLALFASDDEFPDVILDLNDRHVANRESSQIGKGNCSIITDGNGITHRGGGFVVQRVVDGGNVAGLGEESFDVDPQDISAINEVRRGFGLSEQGEIDCFLTGTSMAAVFVLKRRDRNALQRVEGCTALRQEEDEQAYDERPVRTGIAR